MSAQEAQPAPRTDLACAVCVARLAETELDLLPETDAEVVREHLSQCPDCRIFREQVDATREILAARREDGLGADLHDVLEAPPSEPADRGSRTSLERLYRVAGALDVEDADELLQQAVLDALIQRGDLDSRDVVDRLTRAAAAERRDPTESLNEADLGALEYDPDGETAELFYPEFYDEGPDAGRFVDSPNDWGHVSRLAPDDEVATVELYGVTDAAIDGLPEVGMRLIALVDIEGVPFESAAAGLGLSTERAAHELNVARIHVRGAIDEYLRAAEP